MILPTPLIEESLGAFATENFRKISVVTTQTHDRDEERL